jgi:hypothetical protein
MDGMTIGNPYALVKTVRSDAALAKTPQFSSDHALNLAVY